MLTLKTGEAPDAVRLAYEDKKIENKRFRIEDSSKQNILPVFQECCDLMERNFKTPGGPGGVLVHCTMGMSRSASVVIAYSKHMSIKVEDMASRLICSSHSTVGNRSPTGTKLRSREEERGQPESRISRPIENVGD